MLLRTLQSKACINCSNPEDISKHFKDQFRAWRIVLHLKQGFHDEGKVGSRIEKHVKHLNIKYAHLSVQEFLQDKPV